MMNKISLISWNVNSIRARLPLFRDIIKKYSPDIITLQETKVQDQSFPFYELEDLPYNIMIHGQKTYNGVAIFSKSLVENQEIINISPEARFISCLTYGINILCIYVINGMEVGSAKYFEKLDFLDKAKEILREKNNENTIVCGDFNVTTDDSDVYDPKRFVEKITCSKLERDKFSGILSAGYIDKFREYNPKNTYTWWDYRHDSFSKDRGLRIDYVLCSKSISEKITNITTLKETRMAEKPSDHAALLCTIDLEL